MRVGIFTRRAEAYSIKRLKEAFENEGHHVDLLDRKQFMVAADTTKNQLWWHNQAVTTYDAILPRVGASLTPFDAAILRHFQQQDGWVLNPSHAIQRTIDKFHALQVLSAASLPVPRSVMLTAAAQMPYAIEQLGGTPIVIKLLLGTQGIGVMLAESATTAQSIVETLLHTGQQVLLQAFIPESRGRDIRAFVLGGKVIAAMRRCAKGDEFRSNLHRGGQAEAIELPSEYMETACRAAQTMELSIAGVDMLESSNGPVIIEVNASPGLEGIESLTKIDIAKEIALFCAKGRQPAPSR